MKRFLALVFLLAALVPLTSSSITGNPPKTPPGLDRLMRDSQNRALVSWHRATGMARFLRMEAGSISVPGNNPRTRAKGFLDRYGSVLGVQDAERELSAPRQRTDRRGGTHLEYRQLHRGLPVFAGELRVHFDPDGRLTAVNGTFVPDIKTSVRPRLNRHEAEKIAVEKVRETLPPGTVAVLGSHHIRLLIYRTGLIQGVAGVDHLAYEVEVGDGYRIRQFLFIDAMNGKVVEQIEGIHTALDRRIHDTSFGNVIWTEGNTVPYDTGDPPNDAQVNELIDVTEDIYDLFSNLSGGTFLSWNGTDGTMHNVWDIPSTPSIPCPNAFWSGTATYFCNGVTGDDTVAHEWAHAFTESTHNLIYLWQSGALNESYSDIFGEIVDLMNGHGLDTPGGPRTAGGCSTFAGPGPPSLEVNTPAAIAGFFASAGAEFNPSGAVTVTADVELVNDGSAGGGGALTDGCQALVGFTSGRIALVDRGSCPFVDKVNNAQSAGAAGVIIANNAGEDLVFMSGTSGSITISSVFIGQTDGNTIKAELGTGVNASLIQAPAVDASLRWLSGEDDPAFGGAIRDLWEPNCFGDPGKVSDTQFYHCATSDGGGVHTNSGVPNRAFALLVDGGTVNGQTVTGLGITKAAHIYWRAMDIYQVPATDFADHADSLEQSCADLIGMDLADLTTGNPSGMMLSLADCAEVADAMLAVDMRTFPTFCNFQAVLDPNTPAIDCGVTLFTDDFETDPSGTWVLSNFGVFGEYTPRDWQWTQNVPVGGTGSAFFALNSQFLGDCTPGSDDQSGAMRLESPPLTLPADDVFLTFDHSVATEAGWDGGNLKISVNGGSFTNVAAADFVFNAYNSTLFSAPQGNTNPQQGEDAFTGSDGGVVAGRWGQSQVDLTPYALPGDTIRLRFSLGVDGCNGLEGWYVDNVNVCLSCAGSGGADGDSDTYRACDGDCSDGDATTYPDAPEVNDGLDNQCLDGEAGRGLIDEVSGTTGFLNASDITEYSWPTQIGATGYEVARATAPDFSAGCTSFAGGGSPLLDAAVPALDVVYHYLVRSVTPNLGSWGEDSTGVERTFTCGP